MVGRPQHHQWSTQNLRSPHQTVAAKSGEQVLVPLLIRIRLPVCPLSNEAWLDRGASIEQRAGLVDPIKMCETEGLTEQSIWAFGSQRHCFLAPFDGRVIFFEADVSPGKATHIAPAHGIARVELKRPFHLSNSGLRLADKIWPREQNWS